MSDDDAPAPPPAGHAAALAGVDGLGLDLSQALHHVDGRVQTLQRLLRAFVHHAGSPAWQLIDTPTGRPTLHWREACHALRGACATIGARDLHDRLLALERQAAQARPGEPGPGDALRRMHAALEGFVARLDAALDRAGVPAHVAPAPSPRPGAPGRPTRRVRRGGLAKRRGPVV